MKLIGLATLGQNATLRFTQNGEPVASFSAAFNYGRKDDSGKQPTQWVECSLWGKRAESLEQHLTKGKQFYLELSDVHIETFDGRNGQGVKLVGRVAEVEFTRGVRNDDEQRQQPQRQSQRQPQRNDYAAAKGGGGGLADMDSDIPFAPLAARRAAYCV